jgi:hypothetical protein
MEICLSEDRSCCETCRKHALKEALPTLVHEASLLTDRGVERAVRDGHFATVGQLLGLNPGAFTHYVRIARAQKVIKR